MCGKHASMLVCLFARALVRKLSVIVKSSPVCIFSIVIESFRTSSGTRRWQARMVASENI